METQIGKKRKREEFSPSSSKDQNHDSKSTYYKHSSINVKSLIGTNTPESEGARNAFKIISDEIEDVWKQSSSYFRSSEKILLICEDLQEILDTDSSWTSSILHFCLNHLHLFSSSSSSSMDDQINSLSQKISFRTKNHVLAPLALLVLNCFYSMNHFNLDELKKEIYSLLSKQIIDDLSEDLWLSAWICIHFPSICAPILFERLSKQIPQDLEVPETLSITSDNLSSLKTSFKINTIVHLLEFMCDKVSNYLVFYLKEAILSNSFSILCGILMFCPNVIDSCSYTILEGIKNQMDDISEDARKKSLQLLRIIPLAISSFKFEVWSFIRLIDGLSSDLYENYHKFLQEMFSCLIHQSHSDSLCLHSFLEHIHHLRSCIVPLCDLVMKQERRENTVCYLEIIALVTDDTTGLEILFRMFIKGRNDSLSLFLALSKVLNDHYPKLLCNFVKRLIDYLNICCTSDLVTSLTNIHTIILQEDGKMILKALGVEKNFENIAVFLQHSELSVRILTFNILKLMIPYICKDSVAVFLLIQKLFSCLLNQMFIRIKLSLEESLELSKVNWILSHISILIKELSKDEGISLQVIDLLLDFSFSKKADGVLRKEQAGLVPPANYLLVPDPILLISSLESNTDNDSEEGIIKESLLDNNKNRKLFEKEKMQDKTIPPPTITSAEEIKKRKLTEYCYFENQQIILDIIDSVARQTPQNYMKFSDIVLIRITCSYPVPSDEQYLEILPRRSNYDFDVFIRKIFIQNPILVGFMHILANNPTEFCKCFVIVKSLLANMIGDWNIVTNAGNEPNHIYVTLELLKALKKANWFPPELQHCHDILPLIPSTDGTQVLMILWRFIRENAPKKNEFDDNERKLSIDRYEKHVQNIRKILHKNVNTVGLFYSCFYSDSANK